MKAMFDYCVGQTIQLIQGQVQQVEIKTRKRVKVCCWLSQSFTPAILTKQDVLLVGGFGESPYLQEELGKSLALRSINLRRPEKMAS